MNTTAGDKRFEIIAKAKEDLIKSTNIETSEDEMKVLDSFLLRCWQMGWLPDLQNTNVSDTVSRQAAIDAVSKACFELRGVFGRCEDALKALPSAEPKIIHCKDCKYNLLANRKKDILDMSDVTNIVCTYFITYGLKPNDFCSKGELCESRVDE